MCALAAGLIEFPEFAWFQILLVQSRTERGPLNEVYEQLHHGHLASKVLHNGAQSTVTSSPTFFLI